MPDETQDLRAQYGLLLGTYFVMASVLALVVRGRTRGRIPQVKPADVAMLGLATFKLSRLVSKEKVVAPIREPFVEDTEPGEGSEIDSTPAPGGLRHVIGELITCPFCISVWIATVLMAAFALAPRAVRVVAAGLGALTVADSSQYVFSELRKQTG